MLFLERGYNDGVNGATAQFRWAKAPTSDELTVLAHTIAQRIARFNLRDVRAGWYRSVGAVCGLRRSSDVS
jgi:hypothetical protein